LTRLAVNGRLS